MPDNGLADQQDPTPDPGLNLRELEENLAELRKQSLTIISLIPGVAGYGLMIVGGWLARSPLPAAGWAAVALLVVSSVAGLWLRNTHLDLAAHIVVWGTWAATACGLIAYPQPQITPVLTLPIVFASILLDRQVIGAVAVLNGGVVIATIGRRSAWYTPESLVPLLVVLTVAIGAWLTIVNLRTAAAWVLSGYERARRNEREARVNEAELKRALKSLDEATYRLHRANYMMTLARDQAETARRLKQQFAQTISHELRTPLNLVIGFTEVMLQSPEYYGSPLPPPYLRDLAIVYRNADHLLDLVNDVLDLARIEAAQLTLVPERIPPSPLVEGALTTIRGLVESQGLALLSEVEPDLPLIWMDPTRIRQVIFNLVTNATRFTESGSITVGARAEAGHVRFWVSDTGVGIAPDDQERIFEGFQQVDSGPRRPHEGAGLGLTISKSFVELHGGRIWVESEVGSGSTFTFTLPLTSGDDAFSDDVKHLQIDAVRSVESPILLAITRSPSAASLLNRYIHGFRILTVPDLEQAKSMISDVTPQMIVIDTLSESVDGPRLEELLGEWDLPSALLMACPLPGEEVLRRQLAADGYLVKSVSQHDLWDTLRRFGEDVDDVLVIDDDQGFVLLLSRILEDNPLRRYRVRGAGTGQEGLAMVRLQAPDLILLDLRLPDTTGVHVLEELRADEAWADIPVVVVSAQDERAYGAPTQGSVVVTKGLGLRSGEVAQWMQSIADTVIPPTPEPPES